jgi:hypothetical protein
LWSTGLEDALGGSSASSRVKVVWVLPKPYGGGPGWAVDVER